MGNCAENTAKNFKIGRKEQDDYAILSYKRSEAAVASGAISAELVPVKLPAKKGIVIRVMCFQNQPFIVIFLCNTIVDVNI